MSDRGPGTDPSGPDDVGNDVGRDPDSYQPRDDKVYCVENTNGTGRICPSKVNQDDPSSESPISILRFQTLLCLDKSLGSGWK